MSDATRRQLLGLGLTAGTAALLSSAGRAEIGCVNEDIPGDECVAAQDGLRFLVPTGYRPELTPAAQENLTGATLAFIYDSHRPGMTLSIWEKDPRDIPKFDEHVSNIVASVFAGVEKNINKHPVDPVLIMSLLYNESRFSPTAVSPAGALGMAQFMPNTAIEYDLNPVAQPELWKRYRRVRSTERARRRNDREAFRVKYGLAEFSSGAIIDYTLAKDSLDALKEYQALITVDRPEKQLLEKYLKAVREDLAQYDFFAGGEEKLAVLDARTTYASAGAAVNYIADRLSENSGMTSSAVAAYNAGPGAVRNRNPRSILYGYGDLPAYRETVRYLQRVLVVYSKLRAQLAQTGVADQSLTRDA
ncbi:MAG: transglycosylase SLT domain-containing protein [Gammaproteobacteria bacterium]